MGEVSDVDEKRRVRPHKGGVTNRAVCIADFDHAPRDDGTVAAAQGGSSLVGQAPYERRYTDEAKYGDGAEHGEEVHQSFD